MRDLGSAAAQPWAAPEAYGDIGVAADPRGAVANGLGKACRGRDGDTYSTMRAGKSPNPLAAGPRRSDSADRTFWSRTASHDKNSIPTTED